MIDTLSGLWEDGRGCAAFAWSLDVVCDGVFGINIATSCAPEVDAKCFGNCFESLVFAGEAKNFQTLLGRLSFVYSREHA